MKLYAVVKKGVYRHEILGVFNSLESAIEIAKTGVKEEEDHYHSFLVLSFTANQKVDDGELVCTVGWSRNNQLPVVSPENTKEATAEDIVIGKVIWYRDRLGGGHWQVVEEVLKPNDLFKAYCAEDGCRYGLEGALVLKT